MAAQAKSWAERKKKEGGVCHVWVVLSVDEFNHLIQFVEDMPYVPNNDLAQISKRLTDCVTDRNWRGLCEETDYWRERHFTINIDMNWLSLKLFVLCC